MKHSNKANAACITRAPALAVIPGLAYALLTHCG